jgi:hypothetical protein
MGEYFREQTLDIRWQEFYSDINTQGIKRYEAFNVHHKNEFASSSPKAQTKEAPTNPS